MEGIEFSCRLMFLSSVVGLCATFSCTALMFLVIFSPLDAANTSPCLATGADCSESLFPQTFFQVETRPLVDEDVSLSLYSFVKRLSHFEDFLDYCFEFQLAISATIGWPFLFLADIDTAVRLEIFSEISFPCGIGNNCSCIYLSGNSTDFTILY